MASALYRAFMQYGRADDCPIIDLHGHWGPLYGLHLPAQADADVIRHMDRAGVRLLVFCHHHALFSPDIGNAANIRAVQTCPHRLRAWCGINPHYPELVRADIGLLSEHPGVFVGFKMLSSYHQVALTDPRYRVVWEYANTHRLPVLMHTWGGDAFCGVDQVAVIAERYPHVTLVAGHSFHGDWTGAVRLAQTAPNLYLELTAVLDERGAVEPLVEAAGPDRVVFGTDCPWFSYHYYIGALLAAGFSDDDCRMILYGNAHRILANGLHGISL